MATTRSAPIVLASDQGDRRWFYGGGVHTWKATEQQTDGAFLLFEDQMQGGKMTPLHSHPDADETMYVLEGEILVHMDGVEHRLGVGGTMVAPRGVPHAFMVVSDSARVLCLHVPGCCQAFYDAASEPLADGAPAEGPVDFDRIMAAGKATGGMVFLGPPPFARP